MWIQDGKERKKEVKSLRNSRIGLILKTVTSSSGKEALPWLPVKMSELPSAIKRKVLSG